MTEEAVEYGWDLTLGRHYADLTGRAIENPAWDYIKAVPPDDISARYREGYFPDQFVSRSILGPHIAHRARVTLHWTWAIPSPDILDYIVEALDGRSVVELGAGSGYWAWMLSQYGVDVNAYDERPVGHEKSWFAYSSENCRLRDDDEWKTTHPPTEFHPVTQGSVEVLELPENHDRVLFLCWPNYDTSFAYDAVKAFQGDTVIYIGEGSSGCNADWQFFDLVAGDGYRWREEDENLPAITQEWEEVESVPLVQWSGLHDWLTIYRRK